MNVNLANNKNKTTTFSNQFSKTKTTNKTTSNSFKITLMTLFISLMLLGGSVFAVSSIEIDAPLNGDILGGEQTIAWTTDNCNPLTEYLNIQYSTGGIFSTITTVSCEPDSYLWDTTAYPQSSNYQIRLYLDGALGINAISDIFTIDNTAPTAPTVLTPNGGEYLKGETVYEITWVPSTDTNLGPTPITIEYSALGDFTDTYGLENNEIDDGSYLWNVPALNVDTAKLRVIATDLAGNSNSDISDAAFLIDSTAPTTTDNAPTTTDNAPTTWQNAEVTVTLTAEDATSGVASTVYCVDQTDNCIPSTSGTSVSVNTEDTNYIRYTSTDAAGNIEPVKSTPVYIDKTTTTTTDNIPLDWQTTSFIITLTPSDDKMSPTTTYYTTDGTDPTTSSASGTTISINTDGIYTIKYFTVDDAGNSEAIQTATNTAKLDTQAPTTTDDKTDGWYANPITITLTESDANPSSEIKSTKYCTDDGTTACDITAGTDYTTPVKISTEGTTIFRYASTDNAGNTQNTVNRLIIIDTIHPGISINTVKTLTNIETQEIIGTYTETNIETIYVNTILADLDTNGLGTYSATINLVEGENTITATITDLAGNIKSTTADTITLDTQMPSIISYTITPSVFSPNNDGLFDTTSIDLEFSEKVDYVIDIKDSSNVIVMTWTGAAMNPIPKIWDGTGNTGDGEYTVEVLTTDLTGNTVTDETGTVFIDTTAPVIALNGITEITVELGSEYNDEGATALDTYYGDITLDIVTANPVNTNTVGEYTVTYDVTDASKNDAIQVTRTVTVQDTKAPEITLSGDNPQIIEVYDPYTELDAAATDNSGDLTELIKIDSSDVNTNTVGIYTVTYDVTDASGNTDNKERIVEVVDIKAPIIILTGATEVTVELGSEYNDEGATAFDTYYGDITSDIVTANPVDTNAVEEYTITYDVTDTSGNIAIPVTRTVTVEDTTKPEITLIGNNPQVIEVYNQYTELGVIATDNSDDLTDSIVIDSSNVDTNTVGIYTVTYDVTDASGNTDNKGRIVEVVDTTKPTITPIGITEVTVELGSEYNDEGATAFDTYYGDITSDIVTANPVDTNTVGKYIVTYDITDASKNIAIQKTRTVNVEDTTKPVITDVIGNTVIRVGDTTTITATITDLGGISDATLYYTLPGKNETSVTMLGVDNTYTETIPASNTKGEITYYVTATDNMGNTAGNPEPETIHIITVFDLILDMNAGWNLVSVPVTVDRTNVNDVFSDATVWEYDGAGWITPTTIEAGKGYWVSTNENEGLNYINLNGAPTPSAYVPDLTKGWNLIGFTSKEQIDIQTAMEDVEIMGEDYKVSKFLGQDENGNDVWSTYSSLYGGTNFTVNAGEGYWVLASADYSAI